MTLIFDYDGTLHNTLRLYGTAFRKAYAMLVEEGYAPEHIYRDEDISKYLGVNAPDMWKDFMPQLPDKIWQKASAMIGKEMIDGVLGGQAVLYDGVGSVLSTLKQQGYRLLILSNCRTAYMDAHRKALGLDRWFDGYFCAEAYGFIPKEKIFPRLRDAFPDREYLMIGDRDSDFRVGTVNGLRTIGCAYGFGTKEELAPCWAVIRSPEELPLLLNRAGSSSEQSPTDAVS